MKNNKRILVLSGLIVLIVCVTFISISYAYWTSIHVSDNNVVNSNCLNIEFKDLTNEITLNNAYPIRTKDYFENVQDTTIPYMFYITNKCDTIANYDLNLETLSGSDILSSQIKLSIEGYNVGIIDDYSIEGISNTLDSLFENAITYEDYKKFTLFDYEYERVDIGENYYASYPSILLSKFSDAIPTLSEAVSSKRLNQLIINPHETHVFYLDMFLSEDVGPDECQNVSWRGKVTINSVPIRSVKVTFDTNGGDNSIEDKYYYDNGNYGELPIPTREDYTFLGWYYDDESNIINNNDSLVKRVNHTLTAKWRYDNEFSIVKANTFYSALGMCDGVSSYKSCLSSKTKNIENIIPYEGIPSDYVLSHSWPISESGAPTYAWVDGTNLYYYSKADTIYLQNDSFSYYEYHDCGPDGYYLYPNVKNIDLSRFNTSMITNMDNMFKQLTKLEYLNINNFDTSNVTSMREMFKGLYKLEELDVSSFDTSKVTNMSGMFSGLNLKTLNLSNFNTSEVTDMSYMFTGSNYLESINLSSFDTNKVENMSYMFSSCDGLTSLDLSNFSGDSLTDIHGMFKYNDNLLSVDLSGLSGKELYDVDMLCHTTTKIIGYTPSDEASTCLPDHNVFC